MPSAAPARARPMTTAMEPVIMGGSTLFQAAFPIHTISRPMRISRTPVARMPTCANRTPSGRTSVGIIEARRRVERHDGDDDGDVAEAGAVIHRDAAFGDQQRNNGADAAGEQRHADVELGEVGDQDGRREHGQHLLKIEAEHRTDGRLSSASSRGRVFWLQLPLGLSFALSWRKWMERRSRKGRSRESPAPQRFRGRGVLLWNSQRPVPVPGSSFGTGGRLPLSTPILAEAPADVQCPRAGIGSSHQAAAAGGGSLGVSVGWSRPNSAKYSVPATPNAAATRKLVCGDFTHSHAPPKAANETITSRTR